MARQPYLSCQRAHIVDVKNDWMFDSYPIHYYFFASLKHSSSTPDAYASIKSSSLMSASAASFDSCCILDLCLRRNLEKRPRIFMLDSHSVLWKILSPCIVQAVHISFATCSGSCFLSRPI